jgi:hypothetical protein
VVCGWPHLTLAASCGSRDVHHARTTHLLIVASIIVDHSCGLLKMLRVPLPATLGALPDVTGGDVRRCLPAVARGWAKLGHLVAGGVLGGDATQLLDGVPG